MAMYFTALDLGSSRIKGLVAEIKKKDDTVVISEVFAAPSLGVRKGEIVSVSDLVPVLGGLFAKIAKENRAALRNIYFTLNSPKTGFQNSRGIAAVSRADSEIYSDDIERVKKASEAISLNINRTILHTVTKEFVVDGVGDIKDPTALTGSRLEMECVIVDAFKPTVSDAIKAIELAGGRVGGIVYGPFASDKAVLTRIQKELGVACVDIGAGTTGVSIYEEGKLLRTKILPVGSANVTYDLAIGLRSSLDEAEAVKLEFSFADTKKPSPGKPRSDTRDKRVIADIIEMRMGEIFELIAGELKLAGKAGKLPAGVVLTGGGALLGGVIGMAKDELKLPVHRGIPSLEGIKAPGEKLRNYLESEEFAACVGLLLYGTENYSTRAKAGAEPKGFFRRTIGFLRHLLP